MPVVTVKLPEAKESPVLARLTRQFADFQKSALAKSAPSGDGKVLTALLKQQDAMLKAIERMMARMGNGHASSTGQDALLDALKGLKKVLAGLPSDLKGAMKSSMAHQVSARPAITVRPNVTVSMNGLEKRMGQMQDALVAAAKKSRNRTFGSNY